MLPTLYQEFIHLSRYSRWLAEENRRETWEETVARYFDFFEEHLKEECDYTVPADLRKELETAVLNLEIMPSMRALMTAGPALARDNVAGYNCAFVSVNRLRAFDEILYVLMCGTGVGFSCEDEEVKQIQPVAETFHDTDTTIVVADSKIGWAKAYKELIALLIQGQIPQWDTSKVRPEGARLKTFGGRASGPRPLEELFKFTVATFRGAAGRRLSSIECHDIVCKIAEIVVVGGVRRSALISLSSLNDDRMRHAKDGQWWNTSPHRALANNSAVYEGDVSVGQFMEEWLALYNSKSGERGIFNRDAAKKLVGRTDVRDPEVHRTRSVDYAFGTNPCSEIILRDSEFCNLSEIVVRADDTPKTLRKKARLASILGTWQSTLTNFRYLGSSWRKNCEEERLLGVSMTGIMDNAYTNGKKGGIRSLLEMLREDVIEANRNHAADLGIEQSVATTCVKPSGTVSQLVDAASGIHARHNPYYVRTVRGDNKDPLCEFMKAAGFPHEPCVMKPDNVTVFSFPMKAPEDSVYRNDMTALEQLELWLTYQKYWCEHKPSVTISVKEHEWVEVGAWVWNHLDLISGISFLPFSDHSYQQAPYQDCVEDEYYSLAATLPKNVDWTELQKYEQEDTTTGTQTMACTGSSCELVDIGGT